MSNETPPNYLELAADIVSAFVSNNSVSVADLPNLIGNVHAALRSSGQPSPQRQDAKPTPAISIRKSVTPEYVISLEDGKQYKSLKRHLGKLGDPRGLPGEVGLAPRLFDGCGKLCGQAI
jgi:predicted transcriptional regulator